MFLTSDGSGTHPIRHYEYYLTYGRYKYGKTDANAQNHTIDEINLFVTDSASLGDQHENLAPENDFT